MWFGWLELFQVFFSRGYLFNGLVDLRFSYTRLHFRFNLFNLLLYLILFKVRYFYLLNGFIFNLFIFLFRFRLLMFSLLYYLMRRRLHNFLSMRLWLWLRCFGVLLHWYRNFIISNWLKWTANTITYWRRRRLLSLITSYKTPFSSMRTLNTPNGRQARESLKLCMWLSIRKNQSTWGDIEGWRQGNRLITDQWHNRKVKMRKIRSRFQEITLSTIGL